VSDEASKPDTNPNAFAESLQYVRRFVADEVQSTEFSFLAHERVWMDGWVPTKRDCTEELRNHLTVMLDALECMRELCQSAEKYQEQLEEHNVELILEGYRNLPAHERGTGPSSVNAFLKASTMGKKWGFKPEYHDDVQVDQDMAARFDGMSADAQALIRSVFKHGHDSLQDLHHLFE
jgi:Ni,Fe-hydrogenase I large subunit